MGGYIGCGANCEVLVYLYGFSWFRGCDIIDDLRIASFNELVECLVYRSLLIIVLYFLVSV